VCAAEIASEYTQAIGLSGAQLGAVADAAYEAVLNTCTDGVLWRDMPTPPTGSTINSLLGDVFARRLSALPGSVLRPGNDELREKDLVCDHESALSLEIKTSRQAFGMIANKGYVLGAGNCKQTKSRDSMYVVIEFEGLGKSGRACTHTVRLGYLTANDWQLPAKTSTSQRCSLKTNSRAKLATVWEREREHNRLAA
jgi:hypothetical protein